MTNNLILETEEIKRKKQLLKNAEVVLKQEFVGIDDVIENTLLNMRPWFLYPELQDKPLVISLFGMTGCGKTSLVKRLLSLLDIETDMVYFNFAEIGEMKSWEIEDTLDEEISCEKSNRVFVYDEFQYAATIDSNGGEKDNKSGLKPFWELLDTGIIHKRTSRYDIQTVKRILNYAIRIDKRHHIELKHGVWQNASECLMGASAYDVERYTQFFEFNLGNNGEKREEGFLAENDVPHHSNHIRVEDCDGLPTPEESERKSDFNLIDYGPIFIRETYMSRVYELYERMKPGIDKIDLHNKVMEMDFYELCDFLSMIIKESDKGYDMNFSDSIVFVLANLDEAYEISFNVNPDMLPDQFNKITQKLTIVDIKEALRKRFRNEQIARLGNLFMIYPSFSEDSFRKIIDLLLNKYKNDIKEKWGFNIDFDQSIKDFIYTDSVFPTHGTRPIISAVHEIIKTKLPLIVDNLNENSVTCVDKFVYFNEGDEIIIKSYCGDEEVNSFRTKIVVRLNNHRNLKSKSEQTIVAVHESGHFITYVKLYGKLPEKVCSTTVSKDTGGFMLQDVDDYDKLNNKEELLNDIKVYLGGYIAEGLVFGEDKRSCGASKDLSEATKIASTLVRRYGMGHSTHVSTYLNSTEGTAGGLWVREDSQSEYNNEIRSILDKCSEEVKRILTEESWKEMFKQSAKYLTENVNMTKETMNDLYNLIPENKKTKNDEDYYMNALNNF